jgi:hypothetical protein
MQQIYQPITRYFRQSGNDSRRKIIKHPYALTLRSHFIPNAQKVCWEWASADPVV